jgi:hypothetical protein
MSSSLDLEENENSSKNEEENNPFSFKNFLQHSNQNNDEDQLDQLPELDSLPSPSSLPTNLIPSVDDLTATSLIPDLPLPGDDYLRLAHQKIEQQQRHIVKLEREIKILIRKEETDNNQLELVIRQVEKNLKETTERALESEKCCNLLKLDIIKLNEEMNIKNVENKLLRKQIDLLTNKLSSVSNRLTQATKLAKTNLISMMSGVDELTRDLNNINVFMQSFKTNDKISEMLDSTVEIDINVKKDENDDDK